MKFRFYLYAVLFVVLAFVTFTLLDAGDVPDNRNQLSVKHYPVLTQWEESTRRSRSESFEVTTTDNIKLRFADWLPNYQSIIDSIKQGEIVENVGFAKSGIVYQVSLQNGLKVTFESAAEAKRSQNEIVKYGFLLFCFGGIVWSVRKAKGA